jgi:hypothetical protein
MKSPPSDSGSLDPEQRIERFYQGVGPGNPAGGGNLFVINFSRYPHGGFRLTITIGDVSIVID